MRDYNKIFQTMASILETGEHVLRQTARKMEKEASPIIKIDFDDIDFGEKLSDFMKLAFNGKDPLEHLADFNTKDLQFDKVVRNDFSRAVLITKENVKQVFEWLKTHPGVDSAFPGDILSDSIDFTSREDGVKYTAKVGDRIIEEFDGADFYIYPSDSGDFERNFHIIKE